MNAEDYYNVRGFDAEILEEFTAPEHWFDGQRCIVCEEELQAGDRVFRCSKPHVYDNVYAHVECAESCAMS